MTTSSAGPIVTSSTGAVLPSSRTRLEWIDTARGASILLVVLYHATLFAAAAGFENAAWDLVNGAAQPLRMPLFFFLSGLLASRAVERSWRELVPGRLGSNLYLYVLWASLAFAVFSLVPYERQGAPRGFAHWIQSTFLLPENGHWYLLLLALFTAAGKVLRPVPSAFLLPAAAAVSAVACTDVVSASFVWNNCLLLFGFFAAGLRLRTTAFRLSQEWARPRRAGALVLLVGTTALVAAHSGWMQVFGVRTVLGVGAVAAGVAAAAALSGTRLGRPLASLGRNTLPLYLAHEVVLALLVLALAPAAGTSLTDPLRWIAPALLVAAGTGVVVALRRHLIRVPGLLSPPWSPPRLDSAVPARRS
ncbi:acyltransferase family protein [Kineococcus sp. NPDC059986]|uniref:acyltransferase family protein n=1 Tax=Kineococcus sp. NPDC059986 TaxID=3155538 RepID=UPI00344EBCB9